VVRYQHAVRATSDKVKPIAERRGHRASFITTAYTAAAGSIRRRAESNRGERSPAAFPSAISFFSSQTKLKTATVTESPDTATYWWFGTIINPLSWHDNCRSVRNTFPIERIMVQGERTEWNPPRRGKRFDLQWRIWYRMVSETEWHSGMTENISFSGALIHSKASTVPATPVVVVIALPSTPSNPRSCLVGEGRVVRTITPASQAEGSAFAVAVNRYQLDRSGRVLSTITS